MLMELSLYPLDKGESVGSHVARALDVIEKSGLPYHLHAMGTLVEGEWDEVFGVAKKCFETMQKDCHRIDLTIKVDYRQGHTTLLKEKVESIEKKLQHKLQ